MSDYSNIRELLNDFIGRTVVEITQHDKEDWERDGKCFVMLMFDNGETIKFFIGDDGLIVNEGGEEEG